ncbi:thymidine phosphorylase family protein [Actibacterium sp. MT2.3-13A]|uniref:thymidine phosphorylase family protein n=1 Tax=Actibacterium sp. MT2.3-13A TaxID=2828332 RepID=UPI001BA7F5CA
MSRAAGPPPARPHRLLARRSGIDTGDEPVIFMNSGCHVCRAEGLRAHKRVLVSVDGRQIVATAHHVEGALVAPDEAVLSEAAWRRLAPEPDQAVTVVHPPTLPSLGEVRGKIFGNRLDRAAMRAIVGDIVAGRYSDVHSAAFLSACAARPLDPDEVEALTDAMVAVGDRLAWEAPMIADKHCVGGLPGNRTTPIVVAIVAAHGVPIPKTSSRAITSPAGTADVMEVLAPVDLSLAQIRRVVAQEQGCIAWGGAVRLSPADDLLIRIERALDIDGPGQLVASVLSKKIAAGATHVVLDLPIGPTAKIRSDADAAELVRLFEDVAARFGLAVRPVLTDGRQPVGRGIGPALEARDVLAVLQGAPGAPADLRERAVTLAGAILEFVGAVPGNGGRAAAAALADGRAWAKFQRICEAQGGLRTPPEPAQSYDVEAPAAGAIASVDNRKLARVAKLAGAPAAAAAGVTLHVRIGDVVAAGQPLFTVHAQTRGELDYARAYLEGAGDIIGCEAPG